MTTPPVPRLSERSFSLLRLLAMDPLSAEARGSYEKAVSDEAAERLGVAGELPPGSYMLPVAAARDLATVTGGGGFLVGTASAGTYFAGLVGQTIAGRLGVEELPMGRVDGAIPDVSAPAAVTWLGGEDAAIAPTQPTFVSRAAEPKMPAAVTVISHQLARQGSPATEAVVVAELRRALAAAIDEKFFNGIGATGQPLGVLATPGIATASGANIDLAAVVDMIEDVTTAGAPMLRPGWAMDGAVREILMKRARATGVGEMLMNDATSMCGLPALASKTGPAGALVFADWSEQRLAVWGGVRVDVDPTYDFLRGYIAVRVIAMIDPVLRPVTIAARTSVS